jgi:hypothetical protein
MICGCVATCCYLLLKCLIEHERYEASVYLVIHLQQSTVCLRVTAANLLRFVVLFKTEVQNLVKYNTRKFTSARGGGGGVIRTRLLLESTQWMCIQMEYVRDAQNRGPSVAHATKPCTAELNIFSITTVGYFSYTPKCVTIRARRAASAR